MKTSSRPRLWGLLAILSMAGTADLAVLNLYAFPLHLASTQDPELAGPSPVTSEPPAEAEVASAARAQVAPPPAAESTPPAADPAAATTALADTPAEVDDTPAEVDDTPAEVDDTPASASTTPEPAARVGATSPRHSLLEGVEDHVFPNLYFRSGSAAIRPSTIAALARVVAALKEHSDRRMVIEGHADQRGPESLNAHLSAARAHVVRDYLVAAGIAPSRLDVVALGSRAPVDTGDGDAAYARNRRVALIWR